MRMSKACTCGFWISGYTDTQINHLMKIHINSNNHKKQMKAQKTKHEA